MRAAVALLAILGVVVVASTAYTQSGIVGSAHDFSGDAWSGGQICLPCHTPHNADTTVAGAPLWNHAVTTETFTTYTTLSGQTGDANGPSKLCLSCHDGVTAIDAYGGATGSQTMGGAEALGTDLSDDHPVGIDYVTTSSEYAPVADVATAGLFLFDLTPDGLGANRVECGTCHNVHGNANPKLLRVTNDASALCLSCHLK